MTRFTTPLSILAPWLGAIALSAVIGCRSCDPPFGPACADIPPGAIPQPLGTYACQWQTAQAERAELDDFVVYRNEWTERSAQLGPCGRAHLSTIARRLDLIPVQVVVQQSADAELDKARQATVIEFLAQMGVSDAGSRVIIGTPEAEGLYGFEAPRAVRGYTRGIGPGSGAGGAATGFGGAGSGMSGTTGFGGGGLNVGGYF
ncbi:MAG TPA: hypothetical protein VMP01_03280 [Pirellulaceae bacterium]|nr:hypothetical protein [Pirellulaceae bacterium]